MRSMLALNGSEYAGFAGFAERAAPAKDALGLLEVLYLEIFLDEHAPARAAHGHCQITDVLTRQRSRICAALGCSHCTQAIIFNTEGIKNYTTDGINTINTEGIKTF